jgi:hypothetical protein
VRFQRLTPIKDDANAGFDVTFTYCANAPALYLDGVGEIPAYGSIDTVTGGRFLVFRSANASPPLTTVDIIQARDAYRLLNRYADKSFADDASKARVRYTLGDDGPATRIARRVIGGPASASAANRASAFFLLTNVTSKAGDLAGAKSAYASGLRALPARDGTCPVIPSGGLMFLQRPVDGIGEYSSISRDDVAQSAPRCGIVDAGASGAVGQSALSLSDALARKGEFQNAITVLTTAKSTLGSGAPETLIATAEGAQTLSDLSFPPAEFVAGTAGGPPQVAERDFETVDFVPWHREKKEFRGRIRTLLSAYFRTNGRQEPCRHDGYVNCIVSVPQLLRKNYHGYYGRVTMRLMSFVPKGGESTVQVQYSVYQRASNAGPTDLWKPADDSSGTPTATGEIKRDGSTLVTSLRDNLLKLAQ